jgi:hypothetical protein
LVGKHEGKSPHGRLVHRWEDDTKMDLKIMDCEDMAGIYLTEDNSCEHDNQPSGSIKFD